METVQQEISQTKTLQIIKRQKWYINNFIEKLFKINIQDVLVDIVINDDPINPRDNQATIVGRPKMLGSATKQMRHVTPYSFIEAAIKEGIAITERPKGYQSYINNILEAAKPLIKDKKGICLTTDQYSKLISSITLQNEESEIFKLSTTSSEYYLMHSDILVEHFKNCKDFSQTEKNKAEEDFNTKFENYITYGIQYLTKEILVDSKDVNAISIVCEGIARIILTLFNQEKYAAFPEEGNSLKEEIRIYKTKDDAEKALKQGYEVYSHKEITQKIITQTRIKTISEYDARIRIVDNEGSIVKKAAKVLKIISSLVYHKLTGVTHKTIKEDLEYQREYNEKYNFKVNDQNLTCKHKYDEDINVKSNLLDVFPYHITKHLYSVFDFKPLEKKVLAPKQKGDEKTITVYPSATGIKKAEYVVQDGTQYRELQYNSRKGYNDNAIFRFKMSDETTKNVLKNKLINHVIISLLPFKGLEIGCIFNDETQCKNTTILQALCELAKVNYESEGIKLDDTWMINVQDECSRYFSDALGNISQPIEDNYYL